ncbi:hypothetical protein MUK42_35624 [Musa troglodytarum]|uniref:Uncharacterized protein n=1 Tax=Musa troglodytarum TaxID=320322 RepID=A0A9E7FQF5_9LILI|nr:hypothetical protein MUK42_35624 [Musa troglodytarum]
MLTHRPRNKGYDSKISIESLFLQFIYFIKDVCPSIFTPLATDLRIQLDSVLWIVSQHYEVIDLQNHGKEL